MAIKKSPAADPASLLAQPGKGRSTIKYRKNQTIFSQGDPAEEAALKEIGRNTTVRLIESAKESVEKIHQDAEDAIKVLRETSAIAIREIQTLATGVTEQTKRDAELAAEKLKEYRKRAHVGRSGFGGSGRGQNRYRGCRGSVSPASRGNKEDSGRDKRNHRRGLFDPTRSVAGGGKEDCSGLRAGAGQVDGNPPSASLTSPRDNFGGKQARFRSTTRSIP